MESGKRQGTLGTRYEEGGMRDGRQANCDSRYSCKRRKWRNGRDRIYNARWAFKYFIIETDSKLFYYLVY